MEGNFFSCAVRMDAYADGELSETEAAEVERHLASCEKCRAHLSRIRAVRGVVGKIQRPELSAPAMNRMKMAAASAGEALRIRKLGRIAAGLIGIAACLAVAGVIMSLGEAAPKKAAEVATVEDVLQEDNAVTTASRDASVADWMVARLSGSRSSEVSRDH